LEDLMATLSLKTAIGTYPHTKPLKDGTVQPAGFALEHVEVSPIIAAFRRMIRNQEFDVSEMAISTYIVARAHDKPITAIPVFVVRSFPHGATQYNTKSGIEEPKDLEGRRVGVRAYTVTSGLWARGLLSDEYGVDLDKVTWVVVDEEHVQEYQTPPNVAQAGAGKSLETMLIDGEIDAAVGIGRVDSPQVKPLIPNAQQAAFAWAKESGIYPINHTIVIQNRILESDPGVAPALFNAFKEAKQVVTDRIAAGNALPEDDERQRLQDALGTDPLPYGVGPNLMTLEAVIRYNVEQGLIDSPVSVQSLFASNTLDLA
jgi:4,5-dihydroxyphthalate decarboxylase